MIEPHHATRPLKIFVNAPESWDYYRFVKSYRDCWIWHIQTKAVRKSPMEVWYAVECPDETVYFAKSQKDAQIIAGRWSNGLDPKIPEEPEVIL